MFARSRYASFRRRRSYYGKTSARRATRNARSASQQRDSTTVTINRVATFMVTVPKGKPSGALYISHWDQLRNSQFFSNYSGMYDQMKLDKSKMKITGSSINVVSGTVFASPSIVLAVDRNGLSPQQFVNLPDDSNPQYMLNPDIVSTYSSSALRQWSSGNAFVMYQTVYPSTISEKGQYLPTNSLAEPQPASDALPQDFPNGEIPEFPPPVVQGNPCSVWQSTSVPYKPVSLLAVRLPGDSTTGNDGFFWFTIEFEFTVTFRGMRKPAPDEKEESIEGQGLLLPLNKTFDSPGTFTFNANDNEKVGYNPVTITIDPAIVGATEGNISITRLLPTPEVFRPNDGSNWSSVSVTYPPLSNLFPIYIHRLQPVLRYYLNDSLVTANMPLLNLGNRRALNFTFDSGLDVYKTVLNLPTSTFVFFHISFRSITSSETTSWTYLTLVNSSPVDIDITFKYPASFSDRDFAVSYTTFKHSSLGSVFTGSGRQLLLYYQAYTPLFATTDSFLFFTDTLTLSSSQDQDIALDSRVLNDPSFNESTIKCAEY